MDPRLTYSLFMILALVVFVITRSLMPKPAGLGQYPFWKRVVLVLAGFVGGALGAKLPFVFGASTGGWIDAWLRDGKTITTGLIGAYLGVEIAKLALDIRVKTGDSFALPLALALAVGRWGCYFNGCCYGSASDWPWAIDFGDGVLRHPTQVYESFFHLVMAGVLLAIMSRDTFRYQKLKLYLIAYGVFRFATEYLRPEPEAALGLTFYQWVALVLIAGLAVQWQFDRRLRRGEVAPVAL